MNIKTFKKHIFKSILALFLLISISYNAKSQGCTSTTRYPSNTYYIPTIVWKTSASMSAGKYSIFHVKNGESYTWSLCSADGGSSSYDSELTLRNDANDSFLAYSNDYCGDDARITWTSTFTGIVRVVLTGYSCQSISTYSTIAYKENPITIGGSCSPPTTPVTLPFIEDFESISGTYAGQSQVYCGSSHTWNYNPIDPMCQTSVGMSAYITNGGNGALTMERATSTSGIYEHNFILTLNLSNYTSNTNLELSFDFAQHNEDHNNNDRIWIRGSSTDSWLELYDWWNHKAGTHIFVNAVGLDIDALLSTNNQSPSATFQVRFGHGCNSSIPYNGVTFDNIKIGTTPILPLVISNTSANVTCNNTSNGNIDLTVTGGLAPLTYAWSNNATTEDLTNLGPGIYSCTVTDALNSTINTGNITITEPDTITTSTTITNPSCNGVNGLINLSVSGGTSGYSYLWSNSSTSKDLTANGGTYSVTITDANNCTKTITGLTITEPAEILITTSITDAVCNGGTGSIDLSVNGGTSGYSYLWNNAMTTEDLTNVPAGNYFVIVTDANNCMKTFSNIIIGQPTAITTSTTITNITCNGLGDGMIDLSINGGTGSYSYNWNNAATTEDLSALSVGIYEVTVTDANNCTKTVANLEITEPSALQLTAVLNQHACNGNNGSINVASSGGTLPYAIQPASLNTFSPGNYTVMLTDGNGCIDSSASIEIIGAPTAVFDTIVTDLQVVFNNQSTSGDTYSWNFGDGNVSTLENPTHTYTSSGVYTVTLTTTNICGSITSTMIIETIAVSAYDVLSEDLLKVFPNPAKDYLQINHQLTGVWSLELFNAIGQSVLVQSNIKREELFDISNLPTGTYFIRIFNEEEGTSIRKKIQILK